MVSAFVGNCQHWVLASAKEPIGGEGINGGQEGSQAGSLVSEKALFSGEPR